MTKVASRVGHRPIPGAIMMMVVVAMTVAMREVAAAAMTGAMRKKVAAAAMTAAMKMTVVIAHIRVFWFHQGLISSATPM